MIRQFGSASAGDRSRDFGAQDTRGSFERLDRKDRVDRILPVKGRMRRDPHAQMRSAGGGLDPRDVEIAKQRIVSSGEYERNRLVDLSAELEGPSVPPFS